MVDVGRINSTRFESEPAEVCPRRTRMEAMKNRSFSTGRIGQTVDTNTRDIGGGYDLSQDCTDLS
tara:strand:- start:1286 stop:1480 length:195 start_codon:yes stop_codon:yes gene_type:complete